MRRLDEMLGAITASPASAADGRASVNLARQGITQNVGGECNQIMNKGAN